MKRAQDVRKQLIAIMDRYKLELVSAGKNYARICKAITSGFFIHAGTLSRGHACFAGFESCTSHEAMTPIVKTSINPSIVACLTGLCMPVLVKL